MLLVTNWLLLNVKLLSPIDQGTSELMLRTSVTGNPQLRRGIAYANSSWLNPSQIGVMTPFGELLYLLVRRSQ